MEGAKIWGTHLSTSPAKRGTLTWTHKFTPWKPGPQVDKTRLWAQCSPQASPFGTGSALRWCRCCFSYSYKRDKFRWRSTSSTLFTKYSSSPNHKAIWNCYQLYWLNLRNSHLVCMWFEPWQAPVVDMGASVSTLDLCFQAWIPWGRICSLCRALPGLLAKPTANTKFTFCPIQLACLFILFTSNLLQAQAVSFAHSLPVSFTRSLCFLSRITDPWEPPAITNIPHAKAKNSQKAIWCKFSHRLYLIK